MNDAITATVGRLAELGVPSSITELVEQTLRQSEAHGDHEGHQNLMTQVAAVCLALENGDYAAVMELVQPYAHLAAGFDLTDLYGG